MRIAVARDCVPVRGFAQEGLSPCLKGKNTRGNNMAKSKIKTASRPRREESKPNGWQVLAAQKNGGKQWLEGVELELKRKCILWALKGKNGKVLGYYPHAFNTQFDQLAAKHDLRGLELLLAKSVGPLGPSAAA